jgi:hypothetical protein
VADEDTATRGITEAHINALRSDLEGQVDSLRAEIQTLTDAVRTLTPRDASLMPAKNTPGRLAGQSGQQRVDELRNVVFADRLAGEQCPKVQRCDDEFEGRGRVEV